MAPQEQRLLVLSAMLAAVVAFLGSAVASRQKAWRRRRLRQAEWERLYRRLELRLDEDALATSTDWKLGTPWCLRDTGGALRLELHLPRPLLPLGLLLLPARARELRAPSAPRPLRPALPDSLGWYAGPEADAEVRDVEVSTAFLDEVRRAASKHPTLCVEPRRLVITLPAADALPTPREVREALRALRDTALRLLRAVEDAGPPSTLPPPEPAPSPPPAARPARLRAALAERDPWVWLLLLNGSIPFAVLALLSTVDWLFLALMPLYLTGVLLYGMARFGLGGIALVIGAIFTGFGAPYLAVRHWRLQASPTVAGISVREAPRHPDALGFRFTDGTVRADLTGYVTKTSRNRNGGTSRSTSTAMPVVPPDWTPDEPVTVFATRGPPPGDDARPLQGLTEDPTFQGHHREAAMAAAHQYGLRIHPQAVFLDLSQDPDVLRQRMRSEGPWAWGGPHLLWLCAALAHWRRVLRRPGLGPR